MYKVIKFFTDLHDNDHPYNVGDTFPREDVQVTDERVEELSGSRNKQGCPLIAKEEARSEEAPETEANDEPVEEVPAPIPAKAAAKTTTKTSRAKISAK